MGKNSGNQPDRAMLWDIIARVIGSIQPIIAPAVATTATEMYGYMREEMKAEMKEMENAMNEEVFAQNKLEQHERKDTVGICGLPESEDDRYEDTTQVAVDLTCDMGPNISTMGVSVGLDRRRQGARPRPIIVNYNVSSPCSRCLWILCTTSDH